MSKRDEIVALVDERRASSPPPIKFCPMIQAECRADCQWRLPGGVCCVNDVHRILLWWRNRS